MSGAGCTAPGEDGTVDIHLLPDFYRQRSPVIVADTDAKKPPVSNTVERCGVVFHEWRHEFYGIITGKE